MMLWVRLIISIVSKKSYKSPYNVDIVRVLYSSYPVLNKVDRLGAAVWYSKKMV